MAMRRQKVAFNASRPRKDDAQQFAVASKYGSSNFGSCDFESAVLGDGPHARAITKQRRSAVFEPRGSLTKQRFSFAFGSQGRNVARGPVLDHPGRAFAAASAGRSAANSHEIAWNTA